MLFLDRRSNKVTLLLFVILAVASILRLVGVYPGYPPYHSDEGMSYSQGIYMIREKTIDAHGYPLAYAYPNVVPLVNQAFFYNYFIPLSWMKYLVEHAGEIIDGYLRLPLDEHSYNRIFQLDILGVREVNVLVWGRTIAALIGIGVVYLTYVLSKQAFNKWVGLIGSFLVAINYRQVLNSHLDLPDIYNAFFLLLAIITAFMLWKNPSLKNYIVAGIFAAISFSTKWQYHALIPLILVHIFLKDRNWWNLVLTGAVFGLVVLILNPYHSVNYEQTLLLLEDVASKYRAGRNQIDVFSYSHLFNHALGPLTSIFSLVGMGYGFLKFRKQTVIVLSVIISFLYLTTFYTGGGFYTRNFVTITPFFLIFSAVGIYALTKIKFKFFKILVTSVILLVLTIENLPHSIVVAEAYQKPWNYTVLSSWMRKNLLPGSKVAAHSSVPMSVVDPMVLPYEFADAFNIEEFRQNGADFAITNFDWVTNDFYWWMTQDFSNGLLYWQKPVDQLEESWTAMSIEEVASFSVYSVFNPWQAPDSNFVVAKIPSVEVRDKNLIDQVEASPDGKIIEIKDLDGIVVSGEIKTEASNNDGFLYLKFYKTRQDAEKNQNRVGVRLSYRNQNDLQWNIVELASTIPDEAQFARVGYGKYDETQSNVEVRNLELYSAIVIEDLGDWQKENLKLDPNILFPNSHGYL